jgi:hypothetical protein
MRRSSRGTGRSTLRLPAWRSARCDSAGGIDVRDNRAPQFPATLHTRLYPRKRSRDADRRGHRHSHEHDDRAKGGSSFSTWAETLVGEATKVAEGRGVASAYGQGGTHMSCEYQMNTPRQGVGTCSFSNGAQYKVHIGT